MEVILSYDGDILFCKVCADKVDTKKKNIYGHTAF